MLRAQAGRLAAMGANAQAATLIKKVTLIEGSKPPAAQGGIENKWTLPVHTLTFACPGNEKTMPSLGCRIDFGDVVKVNIPEYKPKSYSMSAARPGEFDITFKVYPNGRCSGYLDSLEVGQSAMVFARGKNERRPGTHVGFVAFGVGITEALPIAEAELRKGTKHVHLLWSARTYADMFWHEEIAALQSKHEGAFDVTRILSQEDKDKPGFLPRGRIDAQVLSQVFGHWKKKKKEEEGNVASGDSVVARFLTVGTKPMMRQAEKNLAIAGFPWPQSALLSKPS